LADYNFAQQQACNKNQQQILVLIRDWFLFQIRKIGASFFTIKEGD